MRRIALLVLVVLCSAFLTGCPDWTGIEARDARVAVNAAAMTLEATQTTAELLYYAEQRFIVDRGAAEPGMTKDELAKRVAALREKWKPLKELFPKAREAHQRLAAAIDQNDLLAIAAGVAELAGLQNQIAAGVADARQRIQE